MRHFIRLQKKKEERRGEDENKQLNLIYDSNGEGTYFGSNKIKFLCEDFQPYKAEDSWKIAALLVPWSSALVSVLTLFQDPTITI